MSYRTLALYGFYSFHTILLKPVVVGSSSAYDICIMHQASWVHRHLQACNFVFDPGWRRLSRQWCIHQLFAGRFHDDGAYRKWRVYLHRRRRDGARLHAGACGGLSRPGLYAPLGCGSIKLEQDGLSPMHEPSTGHLYSYVSDKTLATRLSSNNN